MPVLARLDRIKTFAAHFSETVSDPALKTHRHHQGRVWIERPNRFRWVYKTPNAETIVSNGHSLWVYDVALEQVTVHPLSHDLGSTPAMLLAGRRSLSHLFVIHKLGMTGRLAWYRFTPRSPHGTFRRIEVGFQGRTLRVMRLWDRLGEETEIRFSHIRVNAPISSRLFRLQIPSGVAVIGHP
jgi:outer membrane lipoprotein carrier protein